MTTDIQRALAEAGVLWDNYCEAANPNGSTENGAIDLYDIDEMNEAAHALYAALLAALTHGGDHA